MFLGVGRVRQPTSAPLRWPCTATGFAGPSGWRPRLSPDLRFAPVVSARPSRSACFHIVIIGNVAEAGFLTNVI